MFRKRAEQEAAAARRRAVACSQGMFNVVGGGWPLVHPRSFAWVFGPKEDDWLQRTVAGLLVTIGCAQIRGTTSPDGRDVARVLGLGVATTLLAVDVVYVANGRLRWTYLLDGVMEAAWIRAWLKAERGTRPSRKACRIGRSFKGR
jgi:hypothetical protein